MVRSESINSLEDMLASYSYGNIVEMIADKHLHLSPIQMRRFCNRMSSYLSGSVIDGVIPSNARLEYAEMFCDDNTFLELIAEVDRMCSSTIYASTHAELDELLGK